MSKLLRWCVGVLVLAAAISASAPVGAAQLTPTATIEPATGLADLQVVTVRGSGFPPSARIQLMECSGTLAKPPLDDLSCDGTTLNARAVTDDHGSFVNSKTDPSGLTGGFRMFTLPRAGFPPTLTTCDRSHPCVLYVGVEQTDFTQPHVFVPFAFGGASVPGGAGASPGGGGSSSTGWIIGAVVVVIVLVIAGLVVVRRRRSAASNAS